MSRKLTLNQKLFVKEYLKDRNGTRAYIAAYPNTTKETTAWTNSSRLLSNAKVKALIDKGFAKLSKKLEVSQERIIKEYAKIAFFDIKDLFDDEDCLKKIKDMDENTRAVVSGLEVTTVNNPDDFHRIKKIKLNDKLKALNDLSKHLGMFKEKVEHSLDVETIKTIMGMMPQEGQAEVKKHLIEKLK